MFSPNSFFTTNCWETLFNLAQHKWSKQVLCQQFSYSSWSNIKLLMFWMESGAGHVLGTNIILTDFSWEEWMCQWNQRWCWQVERVNCVCVCVWLTWRRRSRGPTSGFVWRCWTWKQTNIKYINSSSSSSSSINLNKHVSVRIFFTDFVVDVSEMRLVLLRHISHLLKHSSSSFFTFSVQTSCWRPLLDKLCNNL